MAGNPNEDLPDLLRGTGAFEPNNTFGYQQAEPGTTYHESVITEGCHHPEASFSLNTSPQWAPSQTNHALWNLRVQQTDMVRAHLDRMHQPAVSQTDFSTLHGSPALHFFENANDGRRGPGHPADHVKPQTTMRGERGMDDARHISPYSTDLNRLFPQENDASNMAMQPQMSPLNFDFQYQAEQATASASSQPVIQQQRHAQIESMVSGISLYDQSMHIVTRQEETPCGVMMDGSPALVGLYGAPDSRSYAGDMVPAHLVPELLSDQIQGVAPAPSGLFTCSHARCEYQHHDKGAYKKHLNTHDPSKKRHKCDHCAFAFMYPKDLRRHKEVVHEDVQEFACEMPGCTAKYNRKDNLARHCRKKHSESRSVLSTDTESTAASCFDEPSSMGSHLLALGPARPGSVVDRNSIHNTPQIERSSFNGCIDPRLMSPTSAPGSHNFSTTGLPYQ